MSMDADESSLRARLVAAGVDLVLREGQSAVSLREIARRAGSRTAHRAATSPPTSTCSPPSPGRASPTSPPASRRPCGTSVRTRVPD
ncbi:TetR/AcrR family transcriptional regulator [Micromonospora sp. M12]